MKMTIGIMLLLCMLPTQSERSQSADSDHEDSPSSTKPVTEAHTPLWQCTVQPDGTFAVDWEEDKLCPMDVSTEDIQQIASRIENSLSIASGNKMERAKKPRRSRDGSRTARKGEARKGEASCTDGDCAHGQVHSTPSTSDLDKGGDPTAQTTPRQEIIALLSTDEYGASVYPDRLEGLMRAINDYGRGHRWVWKQQTETPIVRTTPLLLDGTEKYGCCFDFSGVMVELATAEDGLGMAGGMAGVHKEKTEGHHNQGLITVALDHAIDKQFLGNVITETEIAKKEAQMERDAKTYKFSGYAQFSNHVFVRNGNIAKVYDPSVGVATEDINNLISVHLETPSTFYYDPPGSSRKSYNPAEGDSDEGSEFTSWAVVKQEKVEPVAREDGVYEPIAIERDSTKSRWQLKRSGYWLWNLEQVN